MPATSRTAEFREILKEKQNVQPEAKRRKLTPKRVADGQRDGQDLLGKEYLAEAYVILNHINTLTRMLSAIRKPYLNLDSRNSPLSRQPSRTIDLASSDQSWANIRHLTNEERDQIDLQARVILSRCAERVRELEASANAFVITQGAQNSLRVARTPSQDCSLHDYGRTIRPQRPISSPRTTPA